MQNHLIYSYDNQYNYEMAFLLQNTKIQESKLVSKL